MFNNDKILGKKKGALELSIVYISFSNNVLTRSGGKAVIKSLLLHIINILILNLFTSLFENISYKYLIYTYKLLITLCCIMFDNYNYIIINTYSALDLRFRT